MLLNAFRSPVFMAVVQIQIFFSLKCEAFAPANSFGKHGTTSFVSTPSLLKPTKVNHSMRSMMTVSPFIDLLQSSSVTIADAIDAISDVATATVSAGSDPDTVAAAVEGADASSPESLVQRSYYTILGLYLLSFPGLWSTIKRSTTAKVKRKSYVSPGVGVENGKNMTQQAAEIMAYMKANNYEVVDRQSEVITFRGIVARSSSQAFFLTFCTALGMASLALVLQIQFQDLTLPVIGTPNWFYLVLLSPYAGLFYWKSGDRVDDIQVKLSCNDDESENEVAVEGNDEEIDRMWRALQLTEKGMVKVEAII